MIKDLLTKFNSPSRLIQEGWERFNKIPGGNKIFSAIVGQFIPYTGSISPLVQKIHAGQAIVSLRDKRKVRNHLDSIHAIALANLGEFTTGLSVISQLHNDAKAILVKIEVEYLKKARGDLTAEAHSEVPQNFTQDTNILVSAKIRNLQNEVVTVVNATWRIRP